MRARNVALTVWIALGGVPLARLASRGVAPNLLPLPLAEAAWGWWVALGFAFLQWALGRSVLRSTGTVPFAGAGPETRLAAFTVGFWCSSILLLGLAALRALDLAGVVLYLAVAAAVALLPSVRDRRRGVLPGPPPTVAGAPSPPTPLALAAVVPAVVLALPYVVQSLLPNADWDGASTHLPLAAWLAEQGLSPIPRDLSNLVIPGGTHLVYAAFLALGAESAIIPFNLLASLLCCLAAAALAGRAWGRAAGRWAFAVCASINLLWELGLDPRIDGFLALWCTVAALALVVGPLEVRPQGALILFGLAMGNALGTKYSALVPLALWSPAAAWICLRRSAGGRRATARAALVGLACLVVPAGYWYATNALRYADPLFPMLRGTRVTLGDGASVELGPAVDRLIERDSADPLFRERLAASGAAAPAVPPPATLFDPRSVFLHPERHARKEAHFVSPLLLACLLLPLFRRDARAWWLSWLGLGVFAFIGARTPLARYALPALPLLAAGSGAVLSAARSRSWRAGWAVALALVLAVNLRAEWTKTARMQPGHWLGGDGDRLAWLSRVGYNGEPALPELLATLARSGAANPLAEEGKTLLLGEPKIHLFPGPAIPDISRTGEPWLARLVAADGDPAAVRRGLWDEGVRRILVNVGYFEWVRDNVPVDRRRLVWSLHRLERFNAAFGRIIYDGHGYVLVLLDAPPEPASREAASGPGTRRGKAADAHEDVVRRASALPR